MALHDPRPTDLSDLSSQFYLQEADVGKPRAASCRDRLAELNKAVDVSVVTGDITESLLRKFQVYFQGGYFMIIRRHSLFPFITIDFTFQMQCVSDGAKALV